jgi:hypothetical protein
MKFTSLVSLTMLLAAGLGMHADEPPGGLQSQCAAVKPTERELRWQQIPWVTDLTEGQRLAEQEQRPIFLWVTGDDPLQRC